MGTCGGSLYSPLVTSTILKISDPKFSYII
jgi:hypothetical protein